MDRINPRKIYIGNIPSEYTEKDLENDFAPHGPIHRIEFKGRFGFVEYDSTEDAAKALAAMVGAVRFGERLLVKTFRHIPPRTPGPMGEKYYPRPSESLSKGQGQSRRTPYRVAVLGLHEKTSWQDLKDFGRKVGDVNYADVHRNPEGAKEGVLEYFDEASMKAALRRLSGDLLLGQEVYIVAAGDCGPMRGEMGHNTGSAAGGPPPTRGHFDGYLPEDGGAEYHHHHHHHGGRPVGGLRERGASRSRSFRRDSGRPSSRSRGECRSRRYSHVGSSYSLSGSLPCERVHRSSRELEDTRMSSYVDERRPPSHHHHHVPPAHFNAAARSPRGYHEPPPSGVIGRHGYGGPPPSTSSSAGGPPRGSHVIGGSYVPGESLRGAEGGTRDVVMNAGRMSSYTGGSGGRPPRGGNGGFVPSPAGVREDVSTERGRAILAASPSRHFPTVLEAPRHGASEQPGCRDLSPPLPHHYHHHHRKPLTTTPGTYGGGRHHEHGSRGRSPLSSYVPHHHHGASGEDGGYRSSTAKGYYMYPSETGESHHPYRPPLPRHSSRSLSHPGHRHPPRPRGGGGAGLPGAYIPTGGHRAYGSRRSPPPLTSSAANAGPLGVDGSSCPPPSYTSGSPRRGGNGYGSGYQNGFNTGNRGESGDVVSPVDPRQHFKTRRPRSRESYMAGGSGGQRLRSRSPYGRPMRDEVLDASPSSSGVTGLTGRAGDVEPRGPSLSGGAPVGGTRDSRPPFGGGGHAGTIGQHVGGGGTMATSPLSSSGGGIGRSGVRSPSPGPSNRMDSVHKAPSGGGGGGNGGGYWFEKTTGAERSSRRETLGATAYSAEKR